MSIGHKRKRSERGGLAFRRPGAAEYGVVKDLALRRVDALIGMVRDLDASLDDARRLFSGYQIRIHGTIAIAFLMERNGVLHPSIVRFVMNPQNRGKTIALRMTDAQVRAWSVGKDWSPGHLNQGRVFESALRAVYEVIFYRRHLMSELLGMRGVKMIGTVQARRRADALRRKLAIRLDDMSRKQVRDWSDSNNGNGAADPRKRWPESALDTRRQTGN